MIDAFGQKQIFADLCPKINSYPNYLQKLYLSLKSVLFEIFRTHVFWILLELQAYVIPVLIQLIHKAQAV